MSELVERREIDVRLVRLETLFEQLVASQAKLEEHWIKENDGVQDRLRRLERIVWMASGGVIVAQAVFTSVLLAMFKSLVGV